METRVAVVTAGAWAGGLLAEVGIDLPVEPSRQTVAYFPAIGDPPPVVIDWSQGTVFYALPSPETGIKVGEHRIGPTADPDEEAVADPGWVAALESWVAERLPGVRPNAVHAETCLYTNTSDERFILERHGPIVVGSACSGHAFKFAPLIGQRLADLTTVEGG
jgi:sarcosine oxidase